MRSMHIDFQRRARPPLIGWMVLIAALAGVGWTTNHWTNWLAQESARRQEQLKLQRLAELARSAVPAPIHTIDIRQDKRWQHAALELGAHWTPSLNAIEQVVKPPVYLTAMKSNAASHQFDLEAEAPSLEAALAFLAAMQRDPLLHQAQLLSHETSTDALGHPVVKVAVRVREVNGSVGERQEVATP